MIPRVTLNDDTTSVELSRAGDGSSHGVDEDDVVEVGKTPTTSWADLIEAEEDRNDLETLRGQGIGGEEAGPQLERTPEAEQVDHQQFQATSTPLPDNPVCLLYTSPSPRD